MPDNLTKDWIRTKADEIAVNEHGCYFDIEAANRVVEFMQTFLRHVKGPLAGQPYTPLRWHWNDIIAPVFGWKMPNGFRRHNQFDCFVPKKNAKSTIAAAIKLYMLCADREAGAEVYSAAGDKNQASIIYNVAFQMVKANDELASCIRLRKAQKSMYYDETNSSYKVLTADGSRNEGYDIHCLGIDELHTQKDRKLWAALRYGGASRKQPLVFTISTAGEYDEESLWWERFGIAKKAQASETTDIHYRGIVYAIADSEDWEDPENWKKCNPGWGETINETLFYKDFRDAKVSGANESEFLRYHLNRATRSESYWLKRQYWINCFSNYTPEEEWLDDDDIQQPESAIGVDLADTIDINASVEAACIMHPERGQCVKLSPQFWCPSDAGLTGNKGNRERYLRWWDEGWLERVDGAVVQHSWLADQIALQVAKSPYKVTEIGIDRYHGLQFATHLEPALQLAKKRSKITLIPYNYTSMNEPTKYLESLIISGKIIIENNPVMNWMFSNVQTSTDSSGNRKLDKSSKKNGSFKIDGFAAVCLALYISIHRQMEKMKKRSKYNDPDEKLASIALWGSYELGKADAVKTTSA